MFLIVRVILRNTWSTWHIGRKCLGSAKKDLWSSVREAWCLICYSCVNSVWVRNKIRDQIFHGAWQSSEKACSFLEITSEIDILFFVVGLELIFNYQLGDGLENASKQAVPRNSASIMLHLLPEGWLQPPTLHFCLLPLGIQRNTRIEHTIQSQKTRLFYLFVSTWIVDFIWLVYWGITWGSAEYKQNGSTGASGFVLALSIINFLVKVHLNLTQLATIILTYVYEDEAKQAVSNFVSNAKNIMNYSPDRWPWNYTYMAVSLLYYVLGHEVERVAAEG